MENLETLKLALFANGVDDFTGYHNFVNVKLDINGFEHFINFHDEGQLVIDSEQGFYFAGKWKEENESFALMAIGMEVASTNPVAAIKEFVAKLKRK